MSKNKSPKINTRSKNGISCPKAEPAAPPPVDVLALVRESKEFDQADFLNVVANTGDVEPILVRKALDLALETDKPNSFKKVLIRHPEILPDGVPEISPRFRRDVVFHFQSIDDGPVHAWLMDQVRVLLTEIPGMNGDMKERIETDLRELCGTNDMSPLVGALIEAGHTAAGLRTIQRRNYARKPLDISPEMATKIVVATINASNCSFREACVAAPGYDRAAVIRALIARGDQQGVIADFVQLDDSKVLDEVELHLHASSSAEAITTYAHKVFGKRDTGVLQMRLARLLCPTPEDLALEAVRTGQCPRPAPFPFQTYHMMPITLRGH